MKLRKVKWILFALATLVVAVVVAGYAVLASLDFEQLRGRIQAEAKKATGRDLVIAGPIDLQISLQPAIALEDVRFANAEWGSRPDMVTLDRFEIEVALLPLLSGEIAVRRLVLVAPDILLETDESGRGNWQVAAAGPAAEAETPSEGPMTLPTVNEFLLENARLVYRAGDGAPLALRIERMTARTESAASPLAFALRGRYNDAPFEAEGTVGALQGLLDGAETPFRLRAEAGGATVSLDGRAENLLAGQGLEAELSVEGERLADLGPIAGATLPPLGPYALDAQLRQESPEAFALTGIALRMGGSDLAGQARLALGGARPAVSGRLTSELLDLADFTAGDDTAADAAGPGSPYVFTEDPLPLDALGAIDADLDLSVGRLRLAERLELSEVALKLALAGGRLAVQPFGAGLSGGRLSGDLVLDSGKSGVPVSLALAVEDLDYGALLKDLQITDQISGRLDGQADLRGGGESLRAIAAGLNGRIGVVGGEGRVGAELLGAAGAGLAEMLAIWRRAEDDMRLNCVVARLPVEQGIARAEAILVDTEAATVGGKGTIDLRRETLDLTVTPQAKQTSLMSLAVPFKVGGTLKSPNFTPDPVGTAVGAAKIAGLLINPLAAGAAIALESESADQNPCVAALAGDGGAQGQASPPASKSPLDQATEGAGKALEGVGEGITEGLQRLFGN